MSGEWTAERQLWHQLREHPELLVAIRESKLPELPLQRLLRKTWPDELIPPAFALEQCRRKAEGKFARAAEMWLEKKSLEQSTSEAVARHKARRFREAEYVWDFCAGIGGDALALAQHTSVIAVDLSPVNSLLLEWNAELYGVSDRIHPVTASVEGQTGARGWVHIDPDRRAGKAGRSLRVEDMQPGLDYLVTLPARFHGGAIKLSPASNFGGKFPDYEAELISLNGECKEATLWFGTLGEPGLWRATVLPAGESIAGNPMDAWPQLGELGCYLYDPDPAVVRAGLVNQLAEEQQLLRLDDAEEYLTADHLLHSPFVQTFEVLEELPNNDRAIRKSVRSHGLGQIEIKCRHIPIQADQVRKKLDLSGDQPGVLVYARLAGKARAILCRRVTEE